jgi:hypothetical protein
MNGNVDVRYLHGVKWNGLGLTYRWEVTKSFSVTLSDESEFTINEGFRCDLETVPQLLWWWFPPFGDNIRASIVHDWMYMNRYLMKEFGRYGAQKYADDEYYHLCKVYNPNEPRKNKIRYTTLRKLGHILYTDKLPNDKGNDISDHLISD